LFVPDYIASKKNVYADQVLAKINTAMTNKLNNLKKTAGGKAIIAKYKKPQGNLVKQETSQQPTSSPSSPKFSTLNLSDE